MPHTMDQPEITIDLLHQLCLSSRNLWLFACDCVERALQRERASGREPDKRFWDGIATRRRFCEEKANCGEVLDAGQDIGLALYAAETGAEGNMACTNDNKETAGYAAVEATAQAAAAAAGHDGDSPLQAAYVAASSTIKAARWAAEAAGHSATTAGQKELHWQLRRLLRDLR